MSGITPSSVPLTAHPLANATVSQPLPLSNQTSDPIKSSITSAADPVPGCFEAFLQTIKDFFKSLFYHCFRIPAEKRDAVALPAVPVATPAPVLALAALPATPVATPTLALPAPAAIPATPAPVPTLALAVLPAAPAVMPTPAPPTASVPTLALAVLPAAPAVIPTPAPPTAPAFVRQNTDLSPLTVLISAHCLPIDEKELKDAIEHLSDSFLTKASFDTLWKLALNRATCKECPDQRGNSVVCLKILLENYSRFIKDGMDIPYLTLEIALVSADSPESVSMVIHAMEPNDLISDNFYEAYQLAKTIVLNTGNTAGLEALLEHRTLFTIPFTTYPAAFPYENTSNPLCDLANPNPFIFAFWKVLGKYAPLDALTPADDCLGNRIIRCIVSLNSQLFEKNKLKSLLHPDVLLFPDWSRDYLDLIKTILDSKKNTILDDQSKTVIWLSQQIIKWSPYIGPRPRSYKKFFLAILVAIAKSGRMNMQHTDAEGHHALIDLAMNEDRESLTQLTLQAPGAFNHIQLQDICSMFPLSFNPLSFNKAPLHRNLAISYKEFTDRLQVMVKSAFPQSFATNLCLRIFCQTLGAGEEELPLSNFGWGSFNPTRKHASLQAFIVSFEPEARNAIIAKVNATFEAVYPQMIDPLRNIIAHYYPFGLQEEPSDDPSKQTNYLVHRGLPHRSLPNVPVPVPD